jgi:hypothetical protein
VSFLSSLFFLASAICISFLGACESSKEAL